jgi:tRNA pseudouridine55 synthase
MTSSDLVQKIKRLQNVHKIGHTGTLDKFASGLMILPFGRYTCFASLFLESDKTYRAKARFGLSTDSGDRDGQELESWEPVRVQEWFAKHSETIPKILSEIQTWTKQTPPRISALKVSGKRMSDLHRNGEEFIVKERSIRIYNSKLLTLDVDGFEFECKVSSGTYIRKIIMDIAQKIQIPLVTQNLNRLEIKNLSLENANTLEDFEKGTPTIFQPKEILGLPWVTLEEAWIPKLLKGVQIPLSSQESHFLVQDSSGKILAWCFGHSTGSYTYQKVFS